MGSNECKMISLDKKQSLISFRDISGGCLDASDRPEHPLFLGIIE